MSENFFRILQALICVLCCLLCSAGEEIVRLQELEGNTVTIHTGLTGVQSDAQILWFYGPKNADIKIVNSLVIKGETNLYYYSERFRDRLQLDRNSGSLTITNISREDSGVYKLQIITENSSNWIYKIEVYAPAPTPIIRLKENHTMFPKELCVLVCSVENGKDVNLSWFEEKQRISTTTNSTDSSGNISLPLNITNPNNSTHTCVAANPVSNQTTQLNITELCHNTGSKSKELIAVLASIGLIAVAALAVVWACYCKKKTRRGSSAPERYKRTTYVAVCQQNVTQPCEPNVSFMNEIVQT